MPTDSIKIYPGRRYGSVQLPLSKSYVHRLMIADYLAGAENNWECGQDVEATRRCLRALKGEHPVLDCGESGSTLRFLLPVAMLTGKNVRFIARGRLPQRPVTPFLDVLQQHGISVIHSDFPLELIGRLQPGEYVVPGNISSQIVTGLLLALPCLEVDSRIVLSTPLESRGYVAMTLQLLQQYGVVVQQMSDGYKVPGGQAYMRPPQMTPELDWSAAACWLGMNQLGACIEMPGLNPNSLQPDRCVSDLLNRLGGNMDVSQCPDLFPVLALVAAAYPQTTCFTGIRRLRMKESDRVASMTALLAQFGVDAQVAEDSFVVKGRGMPLKGNVRIDPCQDHRIAMAAAVAATVADGPVVILNPQCVAKSYPDFFCELQKLRFNPHVLSAAAHD